MKLLRTVPIWVQFALKVWEKARKSKIMSAQGGFEPSTILYDTVLVPKPPWLPVLDVRDVS